MTSMACCKLRTFAFAIGLLFLLVQTLLLALCFYTLKDIEGYLQVILDWLEDRRVIISKAAFPAEPRKEASSFSDREYLIRKAGDYLAIPITINVVFIISDTLLIWATVARNKLLMWPWLIIYAMEFLFFVAGLIFLLVILPEPWFKVVIFLIWCPVIVMLGFFWFVVKCYFNMLNDIKFKAAVAAVYHNGHTLHAISKADSSLENHPATMYLAKPADWHHPVPVWSHRPSHYQEHQHKNDTAFPLRSRGGRLNSARQVIEEEIEEDLVAVAHFDQDDDEGDLSSSKSVGSKSKTALSTDGLLCAGSDDINSVVSLSDKYKNQDELEIVHECVKVPPPVRPELKLNQFQM